MNAFLSDRCVTADVFVDSDHVFRNQVKSYVSAMSN